MTLLDFNNVHQWIPDAAIIGAAHIVVNVELATEVYDVDDEYIRAVQTTANGWPNHAVWASPGIPLPFGPSRDIIGPQTAETGELVVDVETQFNHYLNNVVPQSRPHFTVAVTSEQCDYAMTAREGSDATGGVYAHHLSRRLSGLCFRSQGALARFATRSASHRSAPPQLHHEH